MLIKDWKMYYRDFPPMECQAPCSLYSVLLENHEMKDPFYGMNENEYSALSDYDCEFEAVFTVEESALKEKYAELNLYGLDTICEIYINQRFVAQTRNMHRKYTYDVKACLVAGTNSLKLHFKSPTQYFREMNNKHYLYTNTQTIPGAAHLRKALFMSGWDWGPVLPDMGILRKVELDFYSTNRIEDIGVRQIHRENEVQLFLEITTRQENDCEIFAAIDGQRIKLEGERGSITITDPVLWWVRGYGEQYLYDLEIELVKEGTLCDKRHQQIGLRTLTVSTEKLHDGSEFCFVNNGVKIFAMGANYVPANNLLSRITEEKLENIIKTCVDANFNCIRVWGGGYYPEDSFYRLCDQYGILVWQDFMFACVNVWLTEEREKDIRAETVCQVKRLRNHPSLGMLCGNNEIETMIENLDEAGRDNFLVKTDYINLFERILPDICSQLAPDIFYWPSSPSSGGGFDNPDCPSRGDVHYWKVWHGGQPFTDYRKYKFRFCSEYGFESFPSIKTIRSFCEEKDLNCFSRVMEQHQKCPQGNQKMLTYLSESYLYPTSFENLVYASQLLQADAIKYGVAHFRRQRGYCMGSIYWQLNDCWPVASWSSVDCFGRVKALHYAAKKFYAPVAMELFYEDGRLAVNISNETMSDFSGTVYIAVCSSDFSVRWSQNVSVNVAALSSADVWCAPVAAENVYSDYIYADLFDCGGTFIMRQTELFTKPKYFEWKKPDIKVKLMSAADGIDAVLQSDVFAKSVCIDFADTDCMLSDNYVDLTNEKPYSIKIYSNYPVDKLSESVIIKSVYDIDK